MKTFKKLLAALFCIALLGPVVTSCSKNDVRDILLTSDKSWEDIVKERPFMANFPKYGGNIQTLILGPANSTAVTFTVQRVVVTAYRKALSGGRSELSGLLSFCVQE